jgi:ferredoxin
MDIKILDGCIACGVCESLSPDVFVVLETSVVDAANIPGNEDACREAADICPVSVIQIIE